MRAQWVCRQCGFHAEVKQYHWRCPRCGAPLDIDYDFEWRIDKYKRGLQRYASLLPFTPTVSLGEGATPLRILPYSDLIVGFKLEYLNPTGSFKDRGTALTISLAKTIGYSRVIEDTSGNTGVSVAAYSKVAGIEAVIYMPKDAPTPKKLLVKLFGARIVETKSRGEASEAVLGEAQKSFYVAHTWSPLYVEGAKTIVFEVFEEGFHPDAVVVPVGSAGLLLGLYHGFKQLKKMGLVEYIPRLIAVQGIEIHPLYSAVYGEQKHDSKTSRLADGLRVPNPPRLNEAREAIRETKGCVILVDDNKIREGLRTLYKLGFVVEPTSAVVIPALNAALENDCIDKGEKVLVPLTGSGLKMIKEIYSEIAQTH